MSDINPKNPAVLEAMADVDTKRMLLSIAESVTYERIIERGVTYTEQDLRIHSLNYSFKLNEFSADKSPRNIIEDAELFFAYLKDGDNA